MQGINSFIFCIRGEIVEEKLDQLLVIQENTASLCLFTAKVTPLCPGCLGISVLKPGGTASEAVSV